MNTDKTLGGMISHSFILGFLKQLGWMNAVLCVICGIAAVIAFVGQSEQGFALALASLFYAWLWFAIAVLAYGLAHVCRLLEELRDQPRAISKATTPTKPVTFSEQLSRENEPTPR